MPSKDPIFERRVPETLRRLNSVSAHGVPCKKRRLRRSFPPPCGQAVFVTENISRNGKHSLLSPEHFLCSGDSKTGRTSRPVSPCSSASTKRRTSGPGIVSRDKVFDKSNRFSWSNATPTTATPTPTTAISAGTRANRVKCPFLCSRQQTSIDSIQQVSH